MFHLAPGVHHNRQHVIVMKEQRPKARQRESQGFGLTYFKMP
jgi:hypothetical protein